MDQLLNRGRLFATGLAGVVLIAGVVKWFG